MTEHLKSIEEVVTPFPGTCDTLIKCALPNIIAKYNAALKREKIAIKYRDYEEAEIAKNEALSIENNYLDPFKTANKGKICSICTLV